MKHIRINALVVFLLLAIGGCATLGMKFDRYEAVYQCPLVQIDRPDATKERWGAVTTIVPASDSRYAYEDGLFSGEFYAAGSRVHLQLRNKTDHSMKIIWDEAAFIDLDGQSKRVVHAGAKYADMNVVQPPSVVPAHGVLTDFVLPTDRVKWQEGYYSQPGSWEEGGLMYPDNWVESAGDSTLTQASISLASRNIGKRFGLLMPVQIEGVVNEYTFWFEVRDFEIKKGAP